MKRFSSKLLALALCAAFASGAQAAVFTVGNGTGCTHGTIQSAIDAANNSAGTDTIRLTRSLTYEPEANTINTGQELTIEGGYATCTQTTADTTNTVVSGAGGAHAPVFTITAPTGAFIHLRRLTISGGDVDGTGAGGGIRFEGDGILEVADSLITNNTAFNGGGIAAAGTGSNAELVLGANVIISNNTAVDSGGGVYAVDIEMSMLEPGSSILLNHAGTSSDNIGGGLCVYAKFRSSYAYIGSGAPIVGAFYGNTAGAGGGVAVRSFFANVAQLQLFATEPDYPPYVIGNSAFVEGGGIYVTGAAASARLWDTVLDSNNAPNGAAAYLANHVSLYVNHGDLPPLAVPCTVGTDCGRITHNTANTDTNPGAIIYGESDTYVHFGYLTSDAPGDARGGVLIQNNEAGSIIDSSGYTRVFRSVISNNTTSSDVIKQSGNSLDIADSTIAGNSIGGGSAIIRSTGNPSGSIERSILWQPGSTVLSSSSGIGNYVIDYNVANENSSLGGFTGAAVFDPLFVDPAHGVYELRAGSKAIDFAPAIAGNERDAFGRTRDVELPNPNNVGPRDIGALERPAVQPLVLNADFDFSDLRLWTKYDGAWDGTQNVSGGTGSGSWNYNLSSTTATEAIVGAQCIVLPAPGTYNLNGWGKGSGTIANNKSYAIVKWVVVASNTGACGGNLLASGQKTLGGGNAWGHPAQPSAIDVSPAQFGTGVSMQLTLVAHSSNNSSAHSLIAWFDGITLDYIGDWIFADGFE